MKTLKKSLVLLLALAMAVSVFAFGASAVYTDDAVIADEYKEAIDVLTAYGVITGNGDGTLEADRTITRGEFAKILYVAYFGGDSAWTTADKYKGFANFNDVSSDDWYAGVIGYATYKGWILGYGDGNFGPEDPVLGVDAITMILRMLGLNAYGELSDGDTYAARAIDYSTGLGMLVNTDENSVDYDAAIARGAVFEILFRGATEVPAFVKNADSTWNVGTVEIEGYREGDERIDLTNTTYNVLKDRIVTAVPATASELKVENEDTGEVTYKVSFVKRGDTLADNAVNNTAFEIGEEYIGKVVDIRTVKIGTDPLVVAGMTVVSEEVTVTEEDLEDADPATYGYILADGIFSDVDSDNDVVADATYYVLRDDEGEITDYVTRVYDEDAWIIGDVKAELNDKDELELTVGSNPIEEVLGIETIDGITAEGNYLVAFDVKGISLDGNYMTVGGTQVLTASEKVKVEKVTTKDGDVTAFVADGASYEVYPADGLNGKVFLDGTDVAVDVDDEVYVYMFDGKVVVAGTDFYGPTAEEVPTTFDGFAQVLEGRAIISGEFEDDEWTETAASGTVYAKVKVVLDDGTEAMYFLPVTAEKDTDGVTHYTVVGHDGEDVEVFASDESVPPDGYVDLADLGVFTENGIYAYTLEDGDITIMDIADVNTDDVTYTTVDVTDASEFDKDTTTIEGAFAADATFVGTDDDAYKAVAGAANIAGKYAAGNDAVAIKMAVTDEDPVILVVFGGTFEAAAAEPTDSLVYIDVATVTTDKDYCYYDAITASNQTITVKVAKGSALTTTGLYTLKSDNTVDTTVKSGTPVSAWDLNVTGYIKIDGQYYKLSDVVIYGALEEDDTIETYTNDGTLLIYVVNE